MSQAVTLIPKADDCVTHPTATCVCTIPGDHCHLSEYKFSLSKYVKGLTPLTGAPHNRNYTFELTVVNASRSIPPPWGSIRFRLALRTYAPWGVRVVSQTKSRKIPTRNILPLFLASR